MPLRISGTSTRLQDGAHEEQEKQELEYSTAGIVLVATLDISGNDMRARKLVERVLQRAERRVEALHDRRRQESRAVKSLLNPIRKPVARLRRVGHVLRRFDLALRPLISAHDEPRGCEVRIRYSILGVWRDDDAGQLVA